MSVKRKVRKVSIWVIAILFTPILLVFFGAGFFADRIGKAVIKEVNKSLVSDIQIDNYDLTLVRYFPNAAVTLNKVKVPDDRNKGTLLEADELAFKFRLFSLFGSRIKIQSLVVRDGALFVSVDKNGDANYDILKDTGDSGDSGDSDLAIKLEETLFKDVELIYSDEKSKQDLSMNIVELNMSGEFSGDRFDLKSDAKFETAFFETPEGRFFAGKTITYDADVDVDLKNEDYKIQNFWLTIEDNKFGIDGTVKKKGKHYDYDLAFAGKDCTLQSLIGLLPEGYMENLIGLKSKGDFTFTGEVKGMSGEVQMPAVNVQLGLKDGKISGPQLESPFKDLTFTAKFTNGEERTMESSVLEIKDFKGYLARQLIELRLRVSNLNDPNIFASFNGNIPLEAVYKMAGSELLSDAGGEVEIQNFELKGRLEEMSNPDLVYRVKAKGGIAFDDAMLKINGEKMTLDKGKIQLDGNDLSVEDLKLTGAGTDILMAGSFKNLIPVLFADSLNSKDAKLVFNAKLDADEIDLERLMGLSAVPEKDLVEKGEVEQEVYDSLKTQQNENREEFSKYLDGTFEANIKDFKYGEIKAREFGGKLTVRDNQLVVDGGLRAMGGKFDLDGIVFLEKAPRLKAKLVCQGINSSEFFRQTGNFGQDYLTHENIKGTLDANILINAFWSETGEMLMDKLHVITDANFTEGELIGFKMLEDFSTFVKLKNLQHVHFTNTRNWFEIKDEAFHIPVMFIQSNALNLTLNGEQKFDESMDMVYNVKVNAGQTVMRKLFKRAGTKPVKAKNGMFNLYYRIHGNMDDYEMESAKKVVKADFERSEQNKLRIQRQLLEEFGTIGELTDIEAADDDASGEVMEGG